MMPFASSSDDFTCWGRTVYFSAAKSWPSHEESSQPDSTLRCTRLLPAMVTSQPAIHRATTSQQQFAGLRSHLHALTNQVLLLRLLSHQKNTSHVSGKGCLRQGCGVGVARIFSSDSGSPIESFYTLRKLGIPTRACWNSTVSFEIFMKAENSCCVPRFPPIASCYNIVDSQTSVTLCYGVGVGNLERSELESDIFTSDSATLV